LQYYPRVQTEPILQAELVMSLSILRLKCTIQQYENPTISSGGSKVGQRHMLNQIIKREKRRLCSKLHQHKNFL